MGEFENDEFAWIVMETSIEFVKDKELNV